MERQYQRIEIKHLPRKSLSAQLKQAWSSDTCDIMLGFIAIAASGFILFVL